MLENPAASFIGTADSLRGLHRANPHALARRAALYTAGLRYHCSTDYSLTCPFRHDQGSAYKRKQAD